MRYSFFFVICSALLSCEYFQTNEAKQVDIYSGLYLDLMTAAKKNDVIKMGEISADNHLNLDYADSKEGVSLLNWCLINNKKGPFLKLLQLGANPNFQDYEGVMAPTVTEAAALENSEYLTLCLKYGGSANVLSKKGSLGAYQSPLFASISSGYIYPKENLENLKILTEAGADVNLINDSIHGSPLASALLQSKIMMANYLLEHGANYSNLKFVNINGEKLDILFFLRQIDFPLNSEQHQIKMKIVNFLVAKGFNYWKAAIPEDIIKNHKNDTAFLNKY